MDQAVFPGFIFKHPERPVYRVKYVNALHFGTDPEFFISCLIYGGNDIKIEGVLIIVPFPEMGYFLASDIEKINSA